MDFDLNVALVVESPDDCDAIDTSKFVDEITRNTGKAEMEKNVGVGCSFIDLNEGLGLVVSDPDDDLEAEDIHSCSQHAEEETSNGRKESKRMHDDTSEGDGHDDSSDSCLLANEIEKRLEVGCTVADVDACYLLYCEYARLTGFSVRKGDQRYIGRSNEVRWKEFTCSCRGVPDTKRSVNGVAAYRKQVCRSKCTAKLRVGRVELKWMITRFDKSHNHPLVDIDQSYLLRSSRKISFAKQAILQAMHSSGIPVSKACGFMEKMSGGLQNTGFIRKDAYNLFQNIKRETRIEGGDAMAIIEYFNKMSNRDPFFFWKVEKDADDRLMNFFFRDSRCAHDYKAFGDVLSLDTTGGTNRYKLACAPFVGLNHHRKNVMFGIGFLSDERAISFDWLLEAFLESMDGIAPKVVFTDQCKALMNAVDSKFPNAVHRLCHWHINRNALSHFGSLNANEEFKNSWYLCMKGVETEDEFESLWEHMMNSYEIVDREWFNTMYGLCRRWASVFSRDAFTAGLLATSRSECTNKVLKEGAKSTGSLYEFVCGYEDIQSRWRATEREEDTRCLWLPGQIVKDDKLMKHAATIYTRSIYKLFERECTHFLGVFIDFEMSVRLENGDMQFKAKRSGSNAGERTIVFNHLSNSATCSCGKWEREGILCRHILKIYYLKNIDAIPEPYILTRWTKNAKNVYSMNAILSPPPLYLCLPCNFNMISRERSSISPLPNPLRLAKISWKLLVHYEREC